MQDNVKKCKNFLATLIKLASHNSPSPETSKNVKSLVQDLLDAKIEPEEFTSRLQTELKSSPQPYLKSLPALRLSLLSSQHTVTHPAAGTQTSTLRPPPCHRGWASCPHPPPPQRQRHRRSWDGTCSWHGNESRRYELPGPDAHGDHTSCQTARDDDDINDVASMAGVNLNEESARILATNSELVGTHIRSSKKFGVTEVSMEAVTLKQPLIGTCSFSFNVAVISSVSPLQDEEGYEQSADVRSQLRFFEQLERMEKQRKDDQEREILLKAAKSLQARGPEQARLKQKAKEMQQQELAQVSGSSMGSPSGSSAPSSSSRQYARQRITRVNLRDLIFYMEQERETAHSLLLYRALLK
ncbi:hypothetical protein F7725_025966 [Dissostichus mawsoni]|uniref:TAFH domain-containing protein n=1 Tax=Dissostichus mawsoni TaxID=36200 RepID=A0A7J5X5Q6_DISMA|nr:hypothetical protein F7725_025966 [Dissostichus mawsoni]